MHASMPMPWDVSENTEDGNSLYCEAFAPQARVMGNRAKFSIIKNISSQSKAESAVVLTEQNVKDALRKLMLMQRADGGFGSQKMLEEEMTILLAVLFLAGSLSNNGYPDQARLYRKQFIKAGKQLAKIQKNITQSKRECPDWLNDALALFSSIQKAAPGKEKWCPEIWDEDISLDAGKMVANLCSHIEDKSLVDLITKLSDFVLPILP